MLPSLAVRETYVAETNLDAQKQKIGFAWSQKHFCFPDTNVPGLATMKTMLSRFYCYSLKMFLSNGKETTMADCKDEVEESVKREIMMIKFYLFISFRC